MSMQKNSLTIPEFCHCESISKALLYKLWKQGKGPERYKIGRRTLISINAASEWRMKLEKLSQEVK
jgi:predicted DNA-binding transcriptional regulator AlpA